MKYRIKSLNQEYKNFLIIFISIILILISLPRSFVSAYEGDSKLIVSSDRIAIGDTFTVTIELNSNYEMYAIKNVISYNSELLKFVEADDSNASNGIVTVVSAVNGIKKWSTSITFTALLSGNANISLTECTYADENSEKSLSLNQIDINIYSNHLSSNCNLKSLMVDSGKINPDFSPSIMNYYLTIPFDINNINITAEPEIENSTTEISNANNLSVGLNTLNITVTAEDKTKKVYTLNVNRLSQNDTIHSIKFEKYIFNVQLNSQRKFLLNILPLDYNPNSIIWTSSNEDIATVDENGIVTGLSIGSCIVKCKSIDDNIETFCLVNVINKVQSGDVNNDNKLTISDLVSLKKRISGLSNSINEYNADLDENDLLNSTDSVILRKILLNPSGANELLKKTNQLNILSANTNEIVVSKPYFVFTGKSDINKLLYLNNKLVKRDDNGDFSFTSVLNEGNNIFEFNYNGNISVYKIDYKIN